MNLRPLISLNFLVVGLRIASDGEMYVWLGPKACFGACDCETSTREIFFSSDVVNRPMSDGFDGDLVGEDVLGERSARGLAGLREAEDFVGDIVGGCEKPKM